MRKIAAGQSLKAIAQDLCVSPKTVTTYRARILDKMQMKTNADMVRYFADPTIPIAIAKTDSIQDLAKKARGRTARGGPKKVTDEPRGYRKSI